MKQTIKYKPGYIVYLKTDPDQRERLVVCANIYADHITYDLASADTITTHYEIEISFEQDVLKKLTV